MGLEATKPLGKQETRKRKTGGFLLSCLPAFLIWILASARLPAHPIPRDNHDRTVSVRLTATAVQVHYRLEVDEWRARRDLKEADEPAPDSLAQLQRASWDYWAPILANNLQAQLDGQALPFSVCQPTAADASRTADHLVYDFHFQAPWRLSADKEHSFRFRDDNFPGDDASRLELTVAADSTLAMHKLTAPEPALIALSEARLQPGDRDRRRQATAAFRRIDSSTATADRSATRETVPATASLPTPEEDEPDTLFHLLVDTRRGLAMLLLLAAGFGAAHALTPGHGKTLVAAYLVGERGTVWHAVLLGLVTTLTHTAAVIGVAIVLRFFPVLAPAQVQTALELVGGLLVAVLGVWLLMRRLAGQADHIHLGGHGHHHHHTHEPPAPAGSRVRLGQLVLLGMSGGVVPCWDAIALLCLPVSAQRSWLALPLVLAFSAGLAGVLVALGVGVVYARSWAGRGLDSPAGQRVVRLLPLLSAVLITVMGVWLCYDSLHPARASAEQAPAHLNRARH
jgi:ABC-type nickel/cobalt efflux system permease component RcnA